MENRIFSMKTPSTFFTMFGTLGGAASAELAADAFETDIKATGRYVSCRSSTGE